VTVAAFAKERRWRNRVQFRSLRTLENASMTGGRSISWSCGN